MTRARLKIMRLIEKEQEDPISHKDLGDRSN